MKVLTIRSTQITHETNKAICVVLTEKEGLREIWLPKSQIEITQLKETTEIRVPDWLVEEKRIRELVGMEDRDPVTVEFPTSKTEIKEEKTDMEQFLLEIAKNQERENLPLMAQALRKEIPNILDSATPSNMAKKLMKILNGNIF